MADADMWIQEGGIPVPEGSDMTVGTWVCPNDGFTYGPLTGSPYCTAWVQCPYCGATAEIIPLTAGPGGTG